MAVMPRRWLPLVVAYTPRRSAYRPYECACMCTYVCICVCVRDLCVRACVLDGRAERLPWLLWPPLLRALPELREAEGGFEEEDRSGDAGARASD